MRELAHPTLVESRIEDGSAHMCEVAPAAQMFAFRCVAVIIIDVREDKRSITYWIVGDRAGDHAAGDCASGTVLDPRGCGLRRVRVDRTGWWLRVCWGRHHKWAQHNCSGANYSGNGLAQFDSTNHASWLPHGPLVAHHKIDSISAIVAQGDSNSLVGR